MGQVIALDPSRLPLFAQVQLARRIAESLERYRWTGGALADETPEETRSRLRDRVPVDHYHPGQPRPCPRCGLSNWLLGRGTAECGGCGEPMIIPTEAAQ